MWNWFKRIKEVNQEMALISSTTTTELPVPIATEAKRISIENLDARIKRAEKAIFDEACGLINEQINKGHLLAYFDFYAPVYRVDEELCINSIIAAGNDCIKRLEAFGYSAKFNGRYMEISWQYPKEIKLNDIEWSV